MRSSFLFQENPVDYSESTFSPSYFSGKLFKLQACINTFIEQHQGPGSQPGM